MASPDLVVEKDAEAQVRHHSCLDNSRFSDVRCHVGTHIKLYDVIFHDYFTIITGSGKYQRQQRNRPRGANEAGRTTVSHAKIQIAFQIPLIEFGA